MGRYFRNMETNKLEIYLEKEDYGALDPAIKDEIRRHFLFSRKKCAWISRAKFPNLYFAEQIAKKIGLEDEGKVGERLTFAEQQEVKADRAESRACYYDHKAQKAMDEAEKLQKPFLNMDYAAATQPINNNSAGRAFANQRNRIIAAYDKGIEEFRKSEYYANCANSARKTAKNTTDCTKGFCQRRIIEAERAIRAQKKNLDYYAMRMEQVKDGDITISTNGEVLTAETIQKWIDSANEIIQTSIEKIAYYDRMVQDMGGIKFSSNNVHVGDIVKIEQWKDPMIIINTGTKNITYTDMDKRFKLKASYAEIEKILKSA